MTEHEKNVESVKRLGDAIGYGEMMVISSRLWQKKLYGMRLPKSGAFVPVMRMKLRMPDAKKLQRKLKRYAVK